MFLSLGDTFPKLFKVASLMSELPIESKQGYHRRLHFHPVGLEKQKYVQWMPSHLTKHLVFIYQ